MTSRAGADVGLGPSIKGAEDGCNRGNYIIINSTFYTTTNFFSDLSIFCFREVLHMPYGVGPNLSAVMEGSLLVPL